MVELCSCSMLPLWLCRGRAECQCWYELSSDQPAEFHPCHSNIVESQHCKMIIRTQCRLQPNQPDQLRVTCQTVHNKCSQITKLANLHVVSVVMMIYQTIMCTDNKYHILLHFLLYIYILILYIADLTSWVQVGVIVLSIHCLISYTLFIKATVKPINSEMCDGTSRNCSTDIGIR